MADAIKMEGLEDAVELPEDSASEVAEDASMKEDDSTAEQPLSTEGRTETRRDARDDPQSQHRLVIHNLPKYFGFKQLKTWFSKIGLNPSKIKPTSGRGRRGTASSCFLNFRTAEEKENAMRVIAVNTFNGTVLAAQETGAAPDPYKKNFEKGRGGRNDRDRNGGTVSSGKAPEAEILDIVTNLHHLTYEDQLKAKRLHAMDMLRKINKQFIYKSQKTLPWLNGTNGHFCSLEEVKGSPMVEKYRNKCEFSVGVSPTEDRTVGFRLGRYKEGTIFVVSPRGCAHINDTMKSIVEVFQEFVCSSSYPPFDDRDRSGHWHQLTVRTNSANQSMVIVHFHPQQLDPDAVAAEKERLRQYCLSLDKTVAPTYVYWVNDDKTSGGQRRSAAMNEERLIGPESDFLESLLGFTFKISPDAFFQDGTLFAVNTKAAEVLYSAILDVAQVSKNTVLLDLCCGTGAIGIIMAPHVRQGYGVELGEAAVEDAKHNADLNKIENIEFECARVEDALEDILRTKLHPADDVVVVLDPPRCGVHNSVIETIRKADRISRVVYMACAADNEYTINNLYGLCRSKNRNIQEGEVPFVPLKCVPVDLFPLTKNVEMVFVFERAKPAPAVEQTAL